ncbi:unnamed protein product, partial [Brassica rapa subsp. narinosa]
FYLVNFKKPIHGFLHLFEPCFPPPHRHQTSSPLWESIAKNVVTVQSARRSTLTLFPFTSALCLRFVAILLLRCSDTYYVINARRWDGIEVCVFH